MRRVFVGLLIAGLMIAAAISFGGESATSQSPAAKSIALVAMGPVDPALVDRTLVFAKKNTSLKIHLLPAIEAMGNTLDAMAMAACKAMGPDDVALIVLAEPLADIRPHGVILPKQRVVLVNIKSLKPVHGNAETLGRRAEREVMQSIGMLMGVPSCPNPQCAMMNYTTDEELDSKGRNYCPPCLIAVQKAAERKGVGMDMSNFPGAE